MTRLWPEGAPIGVDAPDDAPRAFRWQGRRWPVRAVVDQWVIHDDWWQEEVWRRYFQLLTDDGLLCVVYCDLTTDAWFLERIYD